MGRIQKGRLSDSSRRKNNEKQLRRGAGKQMNEDQGTSANMNNSQGPSVVVDVEMTTPTTSRAISVQRTSANMNADQATFANITVGESQHHLFDHDYFGTSATLPTPRRGVNAKASPAALHMQFKRLRETSQQKEKRLASEKERKAAYRSDQHANHLTRHRNNDAARKNQAKKDGAIFDNKGKHRLGPMNIECRGCGGLHWKEEETQRNVNTFNDCCRHGKVKLQHIPPPTPILLQLFQRSHPLSKNFFENIRALNCSMSFGSINPFPALYQGSRGPHCVKVQGLSSFLFNTSAQPEPGKQPAYPQLYIIDTAQATDIRKLRNPQINRALIETVGAEIKENNLIAQSFVMLMDEMESQQQKADAEGTEIPDIQLHFVRPGQHLDPNTYNLPRTNEVAVVYIPGADNEAPETTVVVKPKDGGLRTLSSTNPMIDRMVYPLFFPHGTPTGWTVGAGCSRAEFVSYHLFARRAPEGQPSGDFGRELNPILMGGDLTQQYVADNAVRVLSDRYKFATNNQEKLKGHLYTAPDKRMEKISAETGRPVGVITILPATITGSPRWEAEQYKDVMAMMMHKGRPDLFVTMTCNPKWPEIEENLLPGQTANDAPVLVSRVFSLKLKALLQFLQHGGIEENAVGDKVFVPPLFGHVTAYVYVIEFQKRGLPHAHILLTLAKENKMITAKEVDAVISAQFPDEKADPEIFGLVARNMVHGPHTETSQCLRESKYTGLPECRFKFPKDYNDETTLNESGYVTYARPDNRRGIMRGGVFLDNRWVASYSPELLRRFDCHINVDRVFGAQSIKYLFKYLCKGADRASLIIDCDSNAPINHDEPRAALDTRYVGPAEGAWIILRKPIQDKSHSIVRMPVNLCRGDNVGEDEDEVANSRMLAEYFALNEKDPNALSLLYHQIPEHYTWISKKWVPRRAHFNTLGRMRHISPSAGDIFYLRILLCHVVGAKSLDEIRTYKGTVHISFKDACIAMGLTQDDKEWEKAIEELCIIEMPSLIRAYFARIMVHCMPAHPEALWEKFKDFMSEDFTRRGHTTAAAYNLALIDISRKLEDEGGNYLRFPGMPELTNPAENIVGADDIVTHRQECKNLAENGYSTLNEEQRKAVDAILKALGIPIPNVEASITADVGGRISKLFFVDGPGGTGKTTIYRLINYFLESNGKTVCNMAFSGIAATLLPRGRTMHNRLGLPVPLFSNSQSTIKATSFKQRQELKETDIFIIDEISNVPKHAVGVMDNLLKIIMENSLPYGGKPVLWGGDFRQIPPVQRHATRSQLVALSVKNSKHWGKFKRFRLTKNMRVLPDEIDFANFLLTVGDGTANDENDFIHLPEQCNVQEDNVGALDIELFKDPILRRDWKTMSERAILAPLNEHVDEWNEKVMAMLPVDNPAEDEATFYSIDKAESDSDYVDPEDYPTEFLNTLKPSGLPPHKLHLRSRAIVQLTRNLAVCRGLSNGTRLEVVRFYERTIICKVLTGPSAGSLEAIPRITLHCDDEYPFILNFLNSPVQMDSYVLEIKHHFLSQNLPPHFELYNRFNQQLALMTTEEERNRTSTMLIIIRHT